MKDPIQNPDSEVAIVIYDSPRPPRYFRFSKRFIKTFFMSVPFTIGLLIIAFFAWGLGSRLQSTPAPKMDIPEVLTSEDSQLQNLESEVESLKKSNEELQLRLSTQPPTPSGAEEVFLSAIKKPYGMQNLTAQKRISLDQFEFNNDSQKATFKFQIISSSPETKVTGHILVLLVAPNGLEAYPSAANNELSQGIKFSTGEPFSVSRLRPTVATFSSHNQIPVKFAIYIFNREGDLLLFQETETYKPGSN